MQINMFNKIADMKDSSRYGELKNTLHYVSKKHNLSMNKSEKSRKSHDRKLSD